MKHNLHFCSKFLLTFVFGFIVFLAAATAEQSINEYGIVIIPEEKCVNIAKDLNSTISQNLPGLENVPNNWHVTLYHGAYEKSDLAKIKLAINNLKHRSFDMKFTNFYTTSDRWVDWGIEKTEVLKNLHRSIVEIASKYHKRPLDRARDVYNEVDQERKNQIDEYGVPGVMNLYNPHMTLFYIYPAKAAIQKIPNVIKDKKYENAVFKASKIVIGELGYNGNILRIVDSIYLK